MSDALLQELLDYKSILELKARFARTADAKDWEGFRAVFHSEGTFDFGGGFVVEGGDAFVTEVISQLEGARSIHRFWLPEINFQSATEATGIWACNDYLEWAPDPLTGERRGFQGFGREYEVYRKIDGAWKIAGWRLHYDRMDPLPRQPLPGSILGGPEVLRDEVYVTGVTERTT
jgi:hypothetical protein